MSKLIKVLATALLFAFEYFFVAIYYPREHSRLALQQGESMQVFESMQALRFAYTYMWIVLVIFALLIWRKELQSFISSAISGR